MNENGIFEGKLLKQATGLLNQQIWCWGQDIECTKGNLLVKYGFERIENPIGNSEPSLYRFDLSPESRVILRGFGVFYGDDQWGGLFLHRFKFLPQLTPESDLPKPPWAPVDLPPLVQPESDQISNCKQLLLKLVDWIHQYEVWIRETIGIEYRKNSLVSWESKGKMITPAEEMANDWHLLGVSIADTSVTETGVF